MPEYYRNQYRSTPSRRVDGPVSMHPTRARRRRVALLISLIAAAVLIVLGGLAALVWGITGLIGGPSGSEDQATASAGSDYALDGIPMDPDAVSTSSLADRGLEPLVDIVAFRDESYVPVKAYHVTSDKAADKASMGRIMDLIDRTEINSMVVEVKDEYGRVAYDSNAPMAVDSGTVRPVIWGGDLDALITTLTERDIVPIARVVCFKDNGLAPKRPDLALIDKNTRQPWKDYKGNTYLNPYNQETWEYIVQVAEDAARRGFREIQFDYIRFPDGLSGDLSTITYPGQNGEKEDAIAGFLAYARPRLEALGVWVSADVFGWILEEGVITGIGQNFPKMAQNLDLICPMVYPDHYPLGYGGIEYPPAEPYKTITRALSQAPELLQGTGAKCRPYLQAHTDILSRHLTYTAEMVKEEIRAAADLGFDEYVLWAGYPDLGGQ